MRILHFPDASILLKERDCNPSTIWLKPSPRIRAHNARFTGEQLVASPGAEGGNGTSAC
ncbi:MAG: hypothetical protein K6L81_11095 [Agarilytica sp.]